MWHRTEAAEGIWDVKKHAVCTNSAKCSHIDWAAFHNADGQWPKTYSQKTAGVFQKLNMFKSPFWILLSQKALGCHVRLLLLNISAWLMKGYVNLCLTVHLSFRSVRVSHRWQLSGPDVEGTLPEAPGQVTAGWAVLHTGALQVTQAQIRTQKHADDLV